MTPLTFSELIAPTANTKFSRLRPAQEHALQGYARDAHAASDIAIELPTGAGKTLIALLILEYWRKQGRTVAILTGNKTLARQLVGEAEGLGAPAVRFEGRGDLFPPKDLRAYRRANAIGVMNYWVYINQNPSVAPADYLVLDDAQLAEGALVSLYTVRVGRYEHRGLFDGMLTLISQYSDTPVADDHVKGIEQGPWGPTDLIPFPVHFEMWEELEALIEQALGSAGASGTDWTGLRFSWSRLRGIAAPSQADGFGGMRNGDPSLHPKASPAARRAAEVADGSANRGARRLVRQSVSHAPAAVGLVRE